METILTYNTLIVLAGTGLLGLASGVLGTYLVLRRRALVSDAVAHAGFPGLCLAFLILGERNFIGFLLGAFATGLLGSFLVGIISRNSRLKEDAAIGIVLSVFFGIGTVLSSYIQGNMETASKAGIDKFIFGMTAGMIASDVISISVVCLVVLAIVWLFAKEFRALSFDHGYATSLGWPVVTLDVLMMSLATTVVIIGLPAVGLALMAALLIIPGAAARFWTDDLNYMITLSGLFGVITGIGGTLLSAGIADLPTGPIIILGGSSIFILSLFFAPKRGVVAQFFRRRSLNQRIEDQNLLRTMYELCESTWPTPSAITLENLLRVRSWKAGWLNKLLRRCLKKGWIREGTQGYCLTKSGWQEAGEVVRIHRLWEIFLIEDAQVAPSLVDRDAERIEHVLPKETVERLEQRLYELDLVPLPLQKVPRRHPSIAKGEEEVLS